MHDGIVFFGLLGVAVAADSIGPARCVIVFSAVLLLRMSGSALNWLAATRKKRKTPLLPKQQAESNVKVF